MLNLSLTVSVEQDGDTWLCRCPELDISTCWGRDEDPEAVILDMIRCYLLAAASQGTLLEVLQQAGALKQIPTPSRISELRLRPTVRIGNRTRVFDDFPIQNAA